MTLDEFRVVVEQEFKLKPQTIEVDANFKGALEWNSLNVMILLSIVKVELGADLGFKGLNRCNTIRDIYESARKLKLDKDGSSKNDSN